jgi:hypothetical protein
MLLDARGRIDTPRCKWGPSSATRLTNSHAYRRKVISRVCVPEVEALDVDLVAWPEGTKPKRGTFTKSSLRKLKVRSKGDV